MNIRCLSLRSRWPCAPPRLSVAARRTMPARAPAAVRCSDTRSAYERTECRTSRTRARPADSPSRTTSTPSLPRSSHPNKPAAASPETAAAPARHRAASSSYSRSQDACAHTPCRTSPTPQPHHHHHPAAATSSEETAPTSRSEPHNSGNHQRTNELPPPATYPSADSRTRRPPRSDTPSPHPSHRVPGSPRPQTTRPSRYPRTTRAPPTAPGGCPPHPEPTAHNRAPALPLRPGASFDADHLPASDDRGQHRPPTVGSSQSGRTPALEASDRVTRHLPWGRDGHLERDADFPELRGMAGPSPGRTGAGHRWSRSWREGGSSYRHALLFNVEVGGVDGV